MSIFISIASYRDPLLWATVADALERAADPSALHFAVVDQAPHASDPPDGLVRRAGSLRYVHLHHRFSRGPCWARAMAASLCRGETYFLQLDAHMVFDTHWDRRLVEQLEALSAHNPRAIISTYPAPFELRDGLVQRKPFPGHALVLEIKPGAVLEADSAVLGFQSRPVVANAAVPGFHVGAGCLFTRCSFIAEVPYDPWLYFHGEEQNLAVRAWTRGWDIHHPPDVPIYHLYHAGDGRPVHWAEGDDAARPVRWWELENASKARLRALLYERLDLGAYGLGRSRSLEDFAAFSGIDYPNRSLRAPARNAYAATLNTLP
jgi:hypothetical protein